MLQCLLLHVFQDKRTDLCGEFIYQKLGWSRPGHVSCVQNWMMGTCALLVIHLYMSAVGCLSPVLSCRARSCWWSGELVAAGVSTKTKIPKHVGSSSRHHRFVAVIKR